MAYTIISQNNTTTTLADENGNVITVPARVTLATSTDYTIIKVNNNSVDLEDGDGKIIRGVPACVVLAGEGGGGGGDVDYSKVVRKADVIPTASASNAGQVYLYTGATNANYTTNYIYKNVKSATYTGTVSFEAATLSGTTVTCSGDNFAAFLTEAGADPTPIVSGTMTYEADATGWRLVGKDSNGNTVTTFIEYVEDYEDFGFTFTGTPQDGDVVAFTCSVTEASATYAWARIDVQPAGVTSVNGQTGDVTVSAVPSQTGYSGRVLGTDGFVAGWVEPERVQRDAMPQASEEEVDNIYQFTGTTDANYTNGYFYKCVSDGQQPATYSWEAVEVQASSGGLPDQTGQSGKFLTTDGTDASWSDKPLVNNTTGSNSLSILGSSLSKTSAIAIGRQAYLTDYSISIGQLSGASIQTHNVCIGYWSSTNGTHSVAVGCRTLSDDYSIAIGGGDCRAIADYSIQLSCSSQTAMNQDTNTFKVANNNGNYEIMSADGTIPTDRFTTTPVADGTYVPTVSISSGVATRSWTTPASAPVVPATTPTLVVADWSSNTQTITVQGVTASNVVLVSPAPASAADYASAGIVCTAQGTNSLTFTCVTVPSNAITLNVVIF